MNPTKSKRLPGNLPALPRQYYARLYQHLGAQGWWPTTPLSSTSPMYVPKRSVQGLSNQDKFEICLGAILTQNTSWNNVVKVLSLLKKENRLTFRALLRRPLRLLEQDVRSSGYFRQKARRIRDFLSAVQRDYQGDFTAFLTGPRLAVRERLLRMKGIGPETADSMLLYAGGHPSFVVDAYTKRIGVRWGLLKKNDSYDEIQKKFMMHLSPSSDLYAEYHALLVELGKRFCGKKPLCPKCPVTRLCREGRRRVR